MSGMSDYTAKAYLNWMTGQASFPSRPSVYLALFTTQPTDGNTGGTEVSGGSYARVQVAGSVSTNASTATSSAVLNFASVPSWIVAGMSVTDATTTGAITGGQTVLSVTSTTVTLSGNVNATVNSGDSIVFSAFAPAANSAPSTISNTNAVITFPQASANWGTVVAWGLYDAPTGGDLLEWDYLGNYQWLPATVSAASPGVITSHAHGFNASDPVVWSNEYGGTVPTFSQSSFTGTLSVVSPTTDTFTVTNGGTAVNTSATGSGMVRKILQQSIPINVTAAFAAGALTVYAA